MKAHRISAVGIAIVMAGGVAACGSSNSNSSSPNSAGSGGSSSGGQSATINGAGSTLAAPIYQQWGSTLKSQNLTVHYNPVGSGAGIT